MTRVRRRRGPILLNAALAVALVTGAGFGYAAVNDDGKSSGTPRVRTAAVARGTVLASVSASGTLVSPSDTGVSFGASGKVTAVNVKVGDQVKAGQVLARMDTAQADEDLAAAQSGVDVAQANLDKAEKGTSVQSSGGQGSGGGSGGGGNNQQADVRPAAAGADQTATEPAAGSSATPRPQTSGSGKQTPAPTVTVTITKTVAASPTPSPSTTVDASQVAQAQNALVQAQNKLAQAQRALDATVLKAPNDGVVASVAGKVGDTVGTSGGSGSGSTGGGSGGSGGSSGSSSSSSTPSGFVVLTNPGGMQAAASFSEADAGKIKAGQAAVVTLNVDSTVKRNAKVVSINPLPDSGGSSGSVKYSARVALDGDLSTLRTGQTASIQVVIQEADNALYVPAGAVTGTGTTGTVQVDVAGSTERRQVELGVKGDQTTQILTGLNEGDLVVIGIQGTTGTGTGSTGQTGTGTTRGGLGGGAGAGSLGIPGGAGAVGGGAGFGGGGR
jgi:macrolide-specific efflux system membrane fusion protein